MKLFLEDLVVGQVFVTATHLVDAAQIVAFARQFDPQPFHLSDADAAGSLFGGLAASGWHTAAISMRLLVDSGPPLAGGIIGGSGELAWPLPVRPGDTLRVEVEVLALTPSRSRPERGTATMRNLTLNQRGETVQSFTVRVVVPRRPA